MKRYVLKRLLWTIPILFGVTLLSFAMIRLAGSDAVLQHADSTGVLLTPELIASERARLGLDQPFFVQYFRWLKGFLSGDFGNSFVSGKPVLDAFWEKLPATLLLTGSATVLTVLISVPLGVLSAVRQDRFSDYLIRFCSFIGNSLPNFFVALILVYLLAICFPVFPVISKAVDLKNAVLPTLTLTIAMSAKYLRQVRAAMLEELHKPYVSGARARGVPFRKILWNSAFRSCLVTLMTLLALSIGSLLGGTAIIEPIFMWDGVGKMAVDAIEMRDLPVIQAYVVWMAVIYVLINLLTDISYRFLDPRIRMEGES
ncbi:MAG: ABC transporter permease [Eubacteriales bacterium]|nr:ABC transporter permease [Eubacteriales bacterium]